MDQGDTLDFKALRAKFQEEDHIMKQPTMKPALPEKPRVVPLAQSPTHFLPAGARPSLLSSISLEGRSGNAPRVIFKEDKKESKKPLIQINSKARDKSEGKSKKGKDKTKASKEKPDEGLTDQKQKNGKEKTLPLLPLLSGATKESTAELVPDVTAPQATVSKKKGFLGFKKSPKRNSAEVPAEPILDTLSLDGPGPAPLIPAPLIPAPLIPAPLIPAPLTPAPLTPAPLIPAPLIPAPSDFGNVSAEPEYGVPKAHLPNIPTLPDAHATVEIFPASLDFIPPPAFIPDTPAPETPTPESETPLELEPPSLPVSRPASQNGIIPDPPSAAPTPPPGRASPMASAPSPSPPELDELAVEEAGIEAVNIAEVEAPPRPLPPPPPPAAADPPASIPPSPKAERPISALAALSRVEDLNPGKRTSPCDQRIFNALEKARRKISPPTNPSTSYSITPPPEELPSSLLELPPIDYEGNALLSKPVNGFDHSQASPVLEGITEEGPDPIPELLVVPPPLKKVLPDPESLGPTPEKPGRPHSVNLSQFIPPPPVRDNEVPAPPEFSETDTTDDLASEAYSHSEWGSGEHTGPDTPDGQNLPEFYSNGMTPPGAEVYAAPDRDNREPESSFQISPESPPPAGLEGDVGAGAYESPENAYETMPTSAAKKKGKSDGLKKRKGPPKNPYGEAQKETNEEKSKLGRFSKNDKKAAAAAATGAEGPDEKELKKREKQRLEKEKKELKEKQEREKKEQKEREKKENEMKKKFKITGQEDAMYQAKVTVTNKGRKNDLPVNSGDIVSIIRTTNCPKGKWLARDGSSNYGYIAVDHVELDIKEMLELGKKAAITRKSGGSSNNNNVVEEEEVTRTGSRASNHYPLSAESFTDDSEEWTGDDEEPLSPAPDPEYPTLPIGHNRTLSMPDMGNKDLSVNHVHSQSDISADGPNVQARQEALQKLATFFRSPKPEKPAASDTEPETAPVNVNVKEAPLHTEPGTGPVLRTEEEAPLPGAASTQEVDFGLPDMMILPPPVDFE